MQTHAAGETLSNPTRVSLHEETDGLEALHRGWAQHVAAWRLAHDAAINNATTIVARMDAVIAKLEAS